MVPERAPVYFASTLTGKKGLDNSEKDKLKGSTSRKYYVVLERVVVGGYGRSMACVAEPSWHQGERARGLVNGYVNNTIGGSTNE